MSLSELKWTNKKKKKQNKIENEETRLSTISYTVVQEVRYKVSEKIKNVIYLSYTKESMTEG